MSSDTQNPAPSPSQPAASAPAPQTRTSLLAVASLIFAILWIPCLLAIICGHLARGAVKRSKGALTGGGIAICGLLLGYLGLFVGIIVIAAGAFFWTKTSDIRADLAAGRDPTASVLSAMGAPALKTFLENEEKLPAPVREKINAALDESAEQRLAFLGEWMLKHAKSASGRLPDTLAQLGKTPATPTGTTEAQPGNSDTSFGDFKLPANFDTSLLVTLFTKHLVIVPGLNTSMSPETVIAHSDKTAADGTVPVCLLDGTTTRLEPTDPRRAKLKLK